MITQEEKTSNKPINRGKKKQARVNERQSGRYQLSMVGRICGK